MPQLAPINWLFLFIMFWLTILVSAAMLWWSYKVEFYLDNKTKKMARTNINSLKSWRW
uniref:ATP synthase F0 subunit 8 n=1 Tax=Perotrochus quoyanus TaxID=160002 RepID=UPI001E6F8B84|nr:ATP synthase F0 subunit 8 [Perotrochus quoyanus]YP_010381779.1 ATP synthase F0 subunit 8 [Perotrochus charlestonensis]UDL72154.1 ATP synthase F0 subunit 8 [Perotrochus quoyanus]UDL72168.1 ATP synthase F0 subunit 8 [Perotrochus charlestonensis]